jgi:hypothetical protein
VGVGVVVGVAVGVVVTGGVGLTVGVTEGDAVDGSIVLCTFLLWSVNPVTELSFPNVCSPTLELLQSLLLRHRFS